MGLNRRHGQSSNKAQEQDASQVEQGGRHLEQKGDAEESSVALGEERESLLDCVPDLHRAMLPRNPQVQDSLPASRG